MEGEIMDIMTYLFDEEAILIPGEGGVGEIFHYIKENMAFTNGRIGYILNRTMLLENLYTIIYLKILDNI